MMMPVIWYLRVNSGVINAQDLERMRVGQYHRTVSTEHLQGAGSWVKLAPLTKADIQQAGALGDSLTNDLESVKAFHEYTTHFLIEHIVDWNWRDEQGVRHPLPHQDPAVLRRIREVEWLFLIELFRRD